MSSLEWYVRLNIVFIGMVCSVEHGNTGIVVVGG